MNPVRQLVTKSGFSTLQRPRFTSGLLLEDEDLNAGVTYTRDLTRLLFKSLFGCGVICGLQVTVRPICNGRKREITVAKGIALDGLGNPIEVSAAQTFEYDPQCEEFPPAIWVAVCYVEKCCRPKDVTCSSDEEGQPQPTRVRAGFEIKLYDALPTCACRCRTKDDEQPQNKPHEECCNEGETAGVQAAAAQQDRHGDQPDNPCPCYSAHFKGECECDCGDTCVVIGKILPRDIPEVDKTGKTIPPENRQATVKTDMVRRVRPVLNGYLDCRFPEHKPTSDPNRSPEPVRNQPTEAQAAQAG